MLKYYNFWNNKRYVKIFVIEIFFMKIVFFVIEKKIFSVVWSFVYVIVKKVFKIYCIFCNRREKCNDI